MAPAALLGAGARRFSARVSWNSAWIRWRMSRAIEMPPESSLSSPPAGVDAPAAGVGVLVPEALPAAAVREPAAAGALAALPDVEVALDAAALAARLTPVAPVAAPESAVLVPLAALPDGDSERPRLSRACARACMIGFVDAAFWEAEGESSLRW